MIPLEEACSFVLGQCRPLASGRLGLREARGLVLAESVYSSVAVPPFDNSAMDGYALRVADCGPGEALRVVGSVSAGEHHERPLGPREAVRIMTGAPIPPGADAVCPVELTQDDAGGGFSETVVLRRMPAVGDHIRPCGDDIRPGDLVARDGDEIHPSTIGVLASIGRTNVECHPRPRVGVLSTGNELLAGAGSAIFDSNRAALTAALESDGFVPTDLGVVSDDVGALTVTLAEATTRCDAVITTGGVSVGDRDVVRLVLDTLPTLVCRSMQVAIKPAKPLAFALLAAPGRSVPLFGLPGNPVSALVSYELFARPGLRKMAGHRNWWRPVASAVAGAPFHRKADGKHHFVSARIEVTEEGSLVVWPLTPQGSHQLRSFDQADALVSLPDGAGVATGARLHALLLRSDTSLSRGTALADLLRRDHEAATPAPKARGAPDLDVLSAPEACRC